MNDRHKTKAQLVSELADSRRHVADLEAAAALNLIEQKRSEAALKLDEARLAGLLRIAQYRADTIQSLLDYALEEAISLTNSTLGYIYFYTEAKREFTLNTWSKSVMEVCSVLDPQRVYQLDQTGLWGEAVRQRRSIAVNDFHAPHPWKKEIGRAHV
jgi:GAF domain-containing protein